MTYTQKAERLKDLIYEANRAKQPRWRNRDELTEYFLKYGCRIKEDRRRKKGYLVSFLQESLVVNGVVTPRIVIEAPMDFAMKVLVLGEFPP